MTEDPLTWLPIEIIESVALHKIKESLITKTDLYIEKLASIKESRELFNLNFEDLLSYRNSLQDYFVDKLKDFFLSGKIEINDNVRNHAAVYYNLKGVVELYLFNTEKAELAFKNALDYAPHYRGAEDNLSYLLKKF